MAKQVSGNAWLPTHEAALIKRDPGCVSSDIQPIASSTNLRLEQKQTSSAMSNTPILRAILGLLLSIMILQAAVAREMPEGTLPNSRSLLAPSE